MGPYFSTLVIDLMEERCDHMSTALISGLRNICFITSLNTLSDISLQLYYGPCQV